MCILEQFITSIQILFMLQLQPQMAPVEISHSIQQSYIYYIYIYKCRIFAHHPKIIYNDIAEQK